MDSPLFGGVAPFSFFNCTNIRIFLKLAFYIYYHSGREVMPDNLLKARFFPSKKPSPKLEKASVL